jgi:hypothetical protein
MADIRATIPTDDWDGFLRRWPVATIPIQTQGPMATTSPAPAE